jgi:adenosylmethionine-8-amino-7-oxononanoate aminotransferase
MCGGKSGTFFGFSGIVEPDIFTMGKGLSGGYFPLSATLANKKIYDKMKDNLWPHGFSYSFSLSGIYSTLAYIDILEKEHILDQHTALVNQTKAIANSLVKQGLITGYNNHGLVFNLELLQDKPLEEVFERFLYKHGLSAGLWNEGGSGLLFIVPLDAPPDWFIELESSLVNALTDYCSSLALTN